MKKGQKGAGGGKDGHDFMHVMAQVMKKRYFIEFAVFQRQGNIFNDQHTQVSRKTEGHFGEHRMNIGMPEDKPVPQGLADIEAENQQRRSVTDNPDEHGIVDNVFQFVFTDKIP